jgi:hypothetical protein
MAERSSRSSRTWTRRLPGLVTGALLLAALGSECDGNERGFKPEGGQLHVSFARGLLAISAEAVEFREVLQAIVAHSGMRSSSSVLRPDPSA